MTLLVASPLTVACSKPADAPDYEARVHDQLKTSNLDDQVKVNWNKDERALHLSGEVKNPADKARAEDVAQQVVGTSGRVVNEVKVEAIDMGKVDDRIEEQLGKMFEDRTEWDFDGKGVTFDSKEGVVTVTGHVESAAVKTKIGERTRAIDGVKDVVNDLQVEASKTPARRRK
ncbi:MAG: BON domain-containing protein [Acidobacteriota bacterium]